jgi:biopolymer transport protein ExbD
MRFRSHRPAAEVTLPVTPMLDMSFQLLFFFLCTFNPVSAREGELPLQPPAAEARPGDPRVEDGQGQGDRPVASAEMTVALRGHRDPRLRGHVSSVTLSTVAGPEELPGTPEQRERELHRRLAEVRAAAGAAGVVRIEAESELRWSEVVRVLDICSKAGFRVHFAIPPG